MKSSKAFKFLLVGGGSGGSVAPLFALVETLREKHEPADFLLVGTKSGPEGHMARQSNIAFTSITTGKLRRYFSMRNLAIPFELVLGFFQSLQIIRKFKPDVIVGVGSFVQVPVCYAGKIMGVPVVIHQQDVLKSLSNSLCAPVAKKISTTFEITVKEFSQGLNLFDMHRHSKVVWTGNPVRPSVLTGTADEAKTFFRLSGELPVLLVLGGGTGAVYINQLLEAMQPELTEVFEIIHVTGKGKATTISSPRYHAFEFLDRIGLALSAADLVLSRAGLSFITELATLGKLSILIPMLDTHQEDNALFVGASRAALVYKQGSITPRKLLQNMRALLLNADQQREIVANIKKLMPAHSNENFIRVVVSAIKQKS